MMKRKMLYVLMSLLGFSACSSENAVLDAPQVYDVSRSDCKRSASKADSRPEYYEAVEQTKATLSLTLAADGVLKGHFENVTDLCGIDRFSVEARMISGNIRLILRPNYLQGGEQLDCICVYDVDFKARRFTSGSHRLQVYKALEGESIDRARVLYDGQMTLQQGQTVQLELNR